MVWCDIPRVKAPRGGIMKEKTPGGGG